MNELLRDVLRERAEVGPPHVDVADVVRRAERRIRRRRLIISACVAVTAVVLGASSALPRLFDSSPQPVDLPPRFAESRLVYADSGGRRIHYGAESFDAPAPARALVATDDGFLLTTASGDVWFTDGEDAEQVGRAVRSGRSSAVWPLVHVDERGPLAAWVESAGEPVAELVVYDTRQRREVARVAARAVDAADPEVVAVDEGAVYWNDGTSFVRYGVETRRQTVVAEAGEAAWVGDVANGFLLHSVPDLAARKTLVGRSIGSGRVVTDIPVPWSDLSWDGRHVLTYGRLLVKTRTDTEVPLRLPARYRSDGGYVEPTGWLDEDTIVLWATARTGQQAILTCAVPSGTCVEAAVEPADADPYWRPVFPGHGQPG